MLFVLSPAKSLDYEAPIIDVPATQARFTDRSAELIGILKTQTPAQLSSLMDISDNLATLNAKRYRAWKPRHDARTSRQAVLAFDGDVYDGLNARSLDAEQLAWAQQHVAILSGLYGVLRPLDRMRPYRLEMGTRLATPKGKDLYQFWGATIAETLNRQLARDPSPVLINLASQEYFRSVDRKALKKAVIECVFEDWHNGEYKIISFSAKKARGMMARFAIETRPQTPQALQRFDSAGYRFAPGASAPDRLVFRRDSGEADSGEADSGEADSGEVDHTDSA